MKVFLFLKMLNCMPICDEVEARAWFSRFDKTWAEILEMHAFCIEITESREIQNRQQVFEKLIDYIDCST